MSYLIETKQKLESITNKTIMFRPDLDDQLLFRKAGIMASSTIYSVKYYLLEFQILASKNKPMPWE